MEKTRLLHHIKAVRLWLDKAEGYLQENNLVRAIAILLLASAEIQSPLKTYFRVKEEPKIIYKPTRIVARFALAASFVLLVGIVGYLIVSVNEKTKIITKVVEKPTKIVVQVPPVEKRAEKENLNTQTTKQPQSYKYIYKYVEEKPAKGKSEDSIPTVVAEEKLPEDVEKKEEKKGIFLTQEEIAELVKLAEKGLKGVQ